MDKRLRLVLVVAILASFVSFLDGSIVNVALPAIARTLGGGLGTQQWVVDAYLVTLGALILVAGSFSDIFGRKRILQWGLIGFGAASLLCAVAPTSTFLIIARGLQGIAGAFLVPSSLALIIDAFEGPAQSKAIGSWTAWTGISFIIGPLLGGLLVDHSSWRLIFAINVLPIMLVLWLLTKLPHDHKRQAGAKVDTLGAVMAVTGLGASVFALIEQPHRGWGSPVIFSSLIVGLLLLVAFIWHEKRAKQPMLPLSLFASRNFSAGNAATVAIYGGLSVATFLIIVFIQQVGGYSALNAGLALLPITFIMFLLSPRFGALAGRYGPRLFMTLGPLVAAVGFMAMLRVDGRVLYATQLLPAILLFGLGLSMTVAPLTSAVLGAVKPAQAGIGSAVNNAVSRIAGLVAVAAIGLITGDTLTLTGFHRGVAVMALLLAAGGVISWFGIQNDAAHGHR